METSEAPPTSTTESDVKAEATVKTETTEQTETTEKKDGEGESTTPTAEGDKKEETTAEGEEKKAEGEEKAEEKKVEPEIVSIITWVELGVIPFRLRVLQLLLVFYTEPGLWFQVLLLLS